MRLINLVYPLIRVELIIAGAVFFLAGSNTNFDNFLFSFSFKSFLNLNLNIQ
jgi:hypothetical protein